MQYREGIFGLITGLASGVAISTYFFKYRKEDSLDDERFTALGIPRQSVIKYSPNSRFIVEYDFKTKNPRWVMEYLTRDDLFNRSSNEGIVEENDKRIDVFYEDNLIPERFRSLKSHFSKSGFDRGHLAAARNHKHKQEDLKMSYSLINVSPQVGVGFNRHYWNRVENLTRKIVKEFGQAFVISGPLFLPNCSLIESSKCAKCTLDFGMLALTTDTKRGVSVPTHFFKMIIVPRDEEKSSFLVSSFVIPNRAIHPKTELMNFFVPIEELEEISGLEFFPKAKEKPVGDLCKMHPSLCMLTSEDTAKKVFSKKDDAIS